MTIVSNVRAHGGPPTLASHPQALEAATTLWSILGSQTIAYIVERVREAGDVSARLIFGEPGLFCNGKVVARSPLGSPSGFRVGIGAEAWPSHRLEPPVSFTIFDASAPMFVAALTDMRGWLDKAEEQHREAELIGAKLAPDMRPLAAQYQMASDSAKNAVARLTGVDAPAMADTEADFAELRDRCDRTIAFIESIDTTAFVDAEDRDITLRFPNGMGYRFTGKAYLTGFALPNFYFHATTAYAILRAAGVPLGKPDFLQHLGQPEPLAEG